MYVQLLPFNLNSVSVVSQQYTIELNSEAISYSESLPSCDNVTADDIVIFLSLWGDVTTDGQGFVTVCIKKNSASYGWAFIHDDNHMTEQLKLGAMHAACRQNGYFGSPNPQLGTQMYVYHFTINLQLVFRKSLLICTLVIIANHLYI